MNNRSPAHRPHYLIEVAMKTGADKGFKPLSVVICGRWGPRQSVRAADGGTCRLMVCAQSLRRSSCWGMPAAHRWPRRGAGSYFNSMQWRW